MVGETVKREEYCAHKKEKNKHRPYIGPLEKGGKRIRKLIIYNVFLLYSRTRNFWKQDKVIT